MDTFLIKFVQKYVGRFPNIPREGDFFGNLTPYVEVMARNMFISREGATRASVFSLTLEGAT